jgi:uncharacterized Zn-finger protein
LTSIRGHADFPIGASPLAPDVSRASRQHREQSLVARESNSLGPESGDERFYICAFEFCRRSFKRLEHLKRHMRTHTNEKPYACVKCTRSFSRQDNLVQHLRTHDRSDPVEYDPSYRAGVGLLNPMASHKPVGIMAEGEGFNRHYQQLAVDNDR